MSKSLQGLYTDYLISSLGQMTATALASLLGGEISNDQVTRFLASPAKTSSDLWRVAKPLVRQIETQDGVLILDDSIEVKPYTDEYVMLEGLKNSIGLNHLALKSGICLSALQKSVYQKFWATRIHYHQAQIAANASNGK